MENRLPTSDAEQRCARFVASSHPVMFYVSLVFLALLASVMVLWIDVPRVAETHEALESLELVEGNATGSTHGDSSDRYGENGWGQLSEEELRFEAAAYGLGMLCIIALLILWPVFIAEQLVGWMLFRAADYPNRLISRLAICVCPPLRLCSRRPGQAGQSDQIWLPRAGWKEVDRQLQRQLERKFSIPMIFIALLILPVLGLQFFFKERIIEYPALRLALHLGTGLIWFAFATEFIVMASVAEKKLNYCKKHWLDLVIILLPLISFLRSVRLLRATKLAKIGKLQQLSRVVRVYRLRGVAMRALRAVMLLEVIHRLLRTSPKKRIAKLEEEYLEKSRELEYLRETIEELKTRYADRLADPDGEAGSDSSTDARPSQRDRATGGGVAHQEATDSRATAAETPNES